MNRSDEDLSLIDP